MAPQKDSNQSASPQNNNHNDNKKKDFFCTFATQTARLSGTPITFVLAVSVILIWAVTGPLFSYSDTWQLVINTGTTIVTFLMVFLIQNTQNRDSEALHLKIDELIRATKGAENAMIDLEDLSQDELDAFKAKFAELAQNGRSGAHDTTHDMFDQALRETIELTDEQTQEWAQKAKKASRRK